ncbi:hypothetical protein QN277_012630 [Acacia crassicarpa]|uniref:BRCT domain-containing protein n=1 Tax=Acacia crassicarpa TaxID=499986 RepID=A0AAE1N1F8_9FABA|nr:hypothetical protein QN277_012630 [Acacia crassicarpa]
MSTYEEVVLDSENEEMHGSRVVTVSKGLLDKKVFRTVKSPRINFQKRHLGPPSPSKQVEKGAADTSVPSFGKSAAGHKETSTDADNSGNKNHLHSATKLSQLPSPEIGELTQDDAVGYVDHYLSVNKVELSPGICHRKTSREKSPPLLSARGAQNLAKKLQDQIRHEEKRPFELVDAGQKDPGAGIFHKRIAVSSNFGVCGQTYTRRKQKSGYHDNRETCSTGNGCEENLAQGLGTVAENNSIKELDVQSDAAGKNVDVYSGVEHTENTSDIGLDTQVAVEAMEALACLPPPEGRCTRIKDQSSKQTKRNNNFIDGGIVRSKKKKTGLTADPFKLARETEYLKKPSSLFGMAMKNSWNYQVQVCPRLSTSSSFSSLKSWHYPKGPRGKRKCPDAKSYPDAPRNWGTQSIIVNGNERSTISIANHIQRDAEGQDTENEACFPNIHPLYNAKCIGTGTIGAGREVSNANATCYKNHKKPSNKNQPKSYRLNELIRLGVSEYAPDLIGKNLRQRKDTSHVRVLLSQHLDERIMKQQKKILARMNISLASSPMEATHFVADKFTRTKNMLETMALGKLVVTHLWLESCGQANCVVDEKKYILRDVKKEKEMGFTMPASLARAKQQPLLQGKSVFITPHIKPDKKVITSLVTAAHGQLVDESQIHACKNYEMLNNLLIISTEEDRELCRPFFRRGIAVYGTELLLSGIVTQKLEFERHQLFANQVARKCLGTSTRRFGKVYRRRRNLYGDHIHG